MSEATIKNHAVFIWSVADLLRGDYKQSEYGKVILPLVVLRRLDCVLEPTKAKVLAEHAKHGDREAILRPGSRSSTPRSSTFAGCSHVCVPSDGGDPHFYGRLLRLLATTGYLGLFASSTRERAVEFRNWDLFGRIPIPRVNVADQRRIGDRIRQLPCGSP